MKVNDRELEAIKNWAVEVDHPQEKLKCLKH